MSKRKAKPYAAPHVPRVCFFDIEATDLRADWGEALCLGYMFQGDKKPTIISVLDDPNFKAGYTQDDKWLIKQMVGVLSTADVLVGHYSKKYDLPFINTRALIHGIPTVPPIAHLDTWRIAKDNLKLQSNRLANIVDIMDLHSKTPIAKDAWRKARKGHKQSLRYVNEHCYHDVIALKETYEKLRPLIKNHPAVGWILNPKKVTCRSCGSRHLQYRGTEATSGKVYRRVFCLDCHVWTRE